MFTQSEQAVGKLKRLVQEILMEEATVTIKLEA